jgi:hypothetical protein
MARTREIPTVTARTTATTTTTMAIISATKAEFCCFSMASSRCLTRLSDRVSEAVRILFIAGTHCSSTSWAPYSRLPDWKAWMISGSSLSHTSIALE